MCHLQVTFLQRVSLSDQISCQLLLSIEFAQQVLLSSCFHSVCHFQVAFLACVVFKLVSLAFVTFQLAICGVYLFHSSFMVSFVFCSQFTFIASVACKFFSWCLPPSRQRFSSISFSQTSFYSAYCPHFFCLFLVSLLGFLSLYSTYPFEASFRVFSSPNLVFVACVSFSLVFWRLLLLYQFYSVCRSPFFRIIFLGVLLLQSLCAACQFGLVLHFYFSFILYGPCFFCRHAFLNILQFALFNPHSLLIIFFFPQLVTVQKMFVSISLFVCPHICSRNKPYWFIFQFI